MDYLIVVLVTVIVSALTFLSGFGLGTLLLPVFILFFPVDIAIAATAIVHLANNLFKALLMGRKADFGVLWKFSLPAAVFAAVGAILLTGITRVPTLASYQLMGQTFEVTPVKLVVALLMLVFSVLEFKSSALAFSPRLVPLGGALSGFFGGLTGHQGALRSAFLVRLGLDKDTFIGTTILSAIVIDVSRLLVYGVTFFSQDFLRLMAQGQGGLIVAGVTAAFLGAVLGFYFIKKVTLDFIHKLIGWLLVLYALALGAGLI